MTYAELQFELSKLTQEQLKTNVVVANNYSCKYWLASFDPNGDQHGETENPVITIHKNDQIQKGMV